MILDTKTEIDNIDAKILRMMLKEPRVTFSEIAKDSGMSIPTIRNRFNGMKKSGIINGAIMQIDPKSVGYNRISLISIETSPKDRKVVHEFLKTQPIAIYTSRVTGKNAILGFAVAKNTDEMTRVINRIKNHPKIRHVYTTTWVDISNMDHPENLIIRTSEEKDSPLKRTKHPSTDTKTKKVSNKKSRILKDYYELDTTDILLINMLSKNARMPFRRMAKKVGVSTNNVIKRYNKLRETTLPFSSITVNLEKLGYIGTGIVSIKVTKHQLIEKTFKKILKIPNIIVAIKLFGNYDILAITPFRVFDDLNKITEQITEIPSVYKVGIRVDKPYETWPLSIISDTIIKAI